jgi:sugar O-acyltransferase (sialic acid O-acetyltransferase NeuD family)
VKPGITGHAQVQGRNALDWNEKFRLDAWYVDHAGNLLDLKILLETVVAVLTRSGINQAGSATVAMFAPAPTEDLKPENRTLVVWGAGGHGKVVHDVAMAMDRYDSAAFVDDNPDRAGDDFCGCPVFPTLDAACGHAAECTALVVAIGANQTRARCAAMARARGWKLETLIHPTAIVSPSARIGAGTVVMPRAVVNAGAEIGENCIINTAAVVEHDCRIGDYVHLSPGVVLGGGVTVERLVHMGLGSIALPGSVIEAGAVVGAGAVVLHGVLRGETVVGVPARSTGVINRQLARVS